MVAESNQIISGSEISINVFTLNQDRWTIVGNIVTGSIVANTKSLPTPFDLLNRKIS